MSRRHVVCVVVLVSSAFACWAIAQEKGPAANSGLPEPGQFILSSAGESAVMLETKSGRSWVLYRSVDGESAWIPAKRIDSDEEALKWRQKEREAEVTRARDARRLLEESLQPKK